MAELIQIFTCLKSNVPESSNLYKDQVQHSLATILMGSWLNLCQKCGLKGQEQCLIYRRLNEAQGRQDVEELEHSRGKPTAPAQSPGSLKLTKLILQENESSLVFILSGLYKWYEQTPDVSLRNLPK